MTAGADKFPPKTFCDSFTSSARVVKTCTASATPHTRGTLIEVDASTSEDADGVIVTLVEPGTFTAATDTSTILEIYTGPATETLWARTLVGYRANPLSGGIPVPGASIIVPGFIASGTRITVAARSAVGSKQVKAYYDFIAATRTVDYGAPVTMGIDTATSRGTALTAPGSLNTKGDWTQIVASTSQAFTALATTCQLNGTTTANSSGVLIDIGIGAEGAETVLIGDIYVRCNGEESTSPRHPVCFGVNVPAGSRLTARYARNSASNAIDLALVGA